jgi:gamma-glutamylcyclotransferase (GGCT)/AIG2-like uncharacterized protein YtfP
MNSQATVQPLPIFVYGTLMIGQPNDYIWEDSIDRVEDAYFDNGCLYDLGYYPVMTEEPHYRIKGQLIHVKQDKFAIIIARLDALEGFDPESPLESVFMRICSAVTSLNAEILDAWTYVGHSEHLQGLPVIEQGDWVAYTTGRSAP